MEKVIMKKRNSGVSGDDLAYFLSTLERKRQVKFRSPRTVWRQWKSRRRFNKSLADWQKFAAMRAHPAYFDEKNRRES
jgi:hypothetical protein